MCGGVHLETKLVSTNLRVIDCPSDKLLGSTPEKMIKYHIVLIKKKYETTILAVPPPLPLCVER